MRQPEELFEGIPAHLRHGVQEWLRDCFGWNDNRGMNGVLMNTLATSLRLPVEATYETGGISDQIFAYLERDDDLFLDALDLTLNLTSGKSDALRTILERSGSAWTVRADGGGLERRASEAAQTTFAQASNPQDAASDELRQAWAAAYSRDPDPSDAWDHAIKAAEEILIPLVVPKAAKPNLGSVAGEIKAHPEKWDFGLPANSGRSNGETLEGLIRHIWPNPDRHGGVAKRAPSQSEAEAAVQVAVVIVELCRDRLTKI